MTQTDPGQQATLTSYDTTDPAAAQGLSTTQKVLQLQQAGYSWLPTQVSYALADSGMSTQDIITKAEALRQVTLAGDRANVFAKQATGTDWAKGAGAKQQAKQLKQQADDGFKVFWSDPVLQKAPSAALALKQYLAGAIGPWPIAQPHLAVSQQQLQLRGYGQGLPTNGVYDGAWIQAQNQYVNDLYQSQLAGNHPGSSTLGHALQSLNALMPTSALNAVLGTITNGIPEFVGDAGRVLQMTNAATAPPSVDTSGNVTAGPDNFKTLQQTPAEAQTNILNTVFGKGTTTKQEATRLANPASVIIQDINTALMLTSTLGAGSRFANAIGETRTALTEAEAAQAGGLITNTMSREPGFLMKNLIGKNLVTAEGATIPGQIARSALGRTATGAVLGAAGTATQTDKPWDIAGGAALGGLAGLATTTNAFNNLPVLSRLGQVIDGLADSTGWYYKARNLAAAPYRWDIAGVQPVAVAGKALDYTTLLGAEARGLTAAQNALGAGNFSTEATSSYHSGVLDTINDAMKHNLDWTPLGIHIAPSLDYLQFFLHGTPTQSSQFVGSQVNQAKALYDDTFASTGAGSVIQALHGQRRAEEVINDIQKTAPGFTKDHWDTFWTEAFNEASANYAALNQRNRMLQEGGLPATEAVNADQVAWIQNKESEILRQMHDDPAVHDETWRQFLADSNKAEQWFRDQIAKAGGQANYEPSRIANYMLANDHIRDNILPFTDQLIGARGGTLPDEPGVLGYAHTDTVLQHDNATAHNAFVQRLAESDDLNRAVEIQRQTFGSLPGVAQGPVAQKVNDLQEAELARGGSFDHTAAAHADTIRTQLEDDVRNYLADNWHIDALQMPQDLQGKIDKVGELTDSLATGVIPKTTASPEVKAAIQELSDQYGYKLAAGTDIGWRLRGGPIYDMTRGERPLIKRLASLGGILNPNIIDQATINSRYSTEFQTRLPAALEAAGEQMPALMSPRTITAYLQREGVIDNPISNLKAAGRELTGAVRRAAQQLGWFKAGGAPDIERATAAMDRYVSLQNISLSQVRNALTNDKLEEFLPEAVSAFRAERRATIADAGFEVPPIISDKAAEVIHQTLQSAAAHIPVNLIGAEKIENLFRVSMGFAGKGTAQRMAAGGIVGGLAALAADGGDPNLGHEVTAALAGAGIAGVFRNSDMFLANLPQNIIKLRNEFRFELDPMFSARRLVKAQVKMGAEGLETTWAPLAAMKKAGTTEYDFQALEEMSGRPGLANEMTLADSMELAIRQADMYGYNPRNQEAFAAGQLKRAGMSTDEGRASLIKMFDYGTGTTQGRSPLERTVNMMFFPFSFDKTLYRNLGGYLLDHNAQRILLTRAMSEYDQFNKEHMNGTNPLATSFWTQHAPLATELTNLNAFAHGVNFGEPGGINRPLLNLFLPQALHPSTDNLDSLTGRIIPMIKEFSRIKNEAFQQGSILGAMAQNMWHDLNGIPALPGIGKINSAGGYTFASPPKSTLSDQAQKDAAFKMQAAWFNHYAAVLDGNAKTNDPNKKVNFPADVRMMGGWAGQPITKTAIREIIHGYYPAFDPAGAAINAITKNSKWAEYKTGLRASDPTMAQHVQDFEDYTTQLGKDLASNKATAQASADGVDLARAKAIWLAEHDSTFYSLYKSQFQKLLGPLEAVK